MTDEINEILRLKSALAQDGELPSGCAFLSDDILLAYPQADGDARYPYACDGLTLWTHSSGNIIMNESKFNIFPDTTRGKEPAVAFFVGEKSGNVFRPVSVTGAASGADLDVRRFVAFTKKAAYYFAETKKTLSVLRVFMDVKKRAHFSVCVKNKAKQKADAYVAAYFDPLLTHGGAEGFWDKCYRNGETTADGFTLKMTEYISGERIEHCAYISSTANNSQKTTSHAVFNGGINRQLASSVPLVTGAFDKEKHITAFSETAIAGEIIPVSLNGGGDYTVHYVLTLSDGYAKTEHCDSDAEFEHNACATGAEHARVFEFDGLKDGFAPHEKTLSCFINSVVRQVEFCTTSKNYAGDMIGIRDIFQQIEGALPTMPDYCRKKIIEAISFIGEDGRAPRQYSYPQKEGIPPVMDLREYIDQGCWIISTVHAYLRYTGDFTILDEICGYYKFDDGKVNMSNRRDGVLEHLLSITDYLLSNIDENTNCLKALYGDWNDALDGLGRTDKQGQRFGDGVSVMATLQLYKNLGELIEILDKTGTHKDKTEKYRAARQSIKRGLEQNAVKNGKVLHGWGDERKWYVGSDNDCDGKSRDGLTGNAFWVMSGMINDSEAVDKKDILKAYDRLDGKYGLKTFAPHFESDCAEVGRLSRLPKGTAENGATYIHATLFGIMSLFDMGESERAWGQLYKILPITHKFTSTSPFVMSNSYAENAELDLDGESISDWFTGSGCVLLKTLYGKVFGVNPTFEGVEITPAENPPFARGECIVIIKGKHITVRLLKGDGARKIFIPTEQLRDGQMVEVYV